MTASPTPPPPPDPPAPPPKEGRAWRVLAVLAWIYMAALAATVALIVVVGEAWWIGTVAIYVPRLPLLLPLVVLIPLAFRKSRRTVFAIQAALAIVVVVALAGPHVSFARASGGPSVRVLSYNVWYGRRGGGEPVAREVEASGAQIILLQAMHGSVAKAVRERLGPEWNYHSTTEFFLATRYPIVSVALRGGDADRFIQYTLDTPLGLVDVFNMHPYSPRTGLFQLRNQSKKKLLSDGPSDEAVESVESNALRREDQVSKLVAAATEAKNPIIIAGDTNLPEWSAFYRKHLARWQDGFAQAGTGFGYTFPANRGLPWMRIDRVLAGPELKFTSFKVGGRTGSDHCPVMADLEKR